MHLQEDIYLSQYRIPGLVSQVLHALFYCGTVVGEYRPINVTHRILPMTGLGQRNVAAALSWMRKKNIVTTEYNRREKVLYIKLLQFSEWKK